VSSHFRGKPSVALCITLLLVALHGFAGKLHAQTLSVSPHGGTLTEPWNTSGLSINFPISGTQSGNTYFVELLCQGQVYQCSTSISPQQSFTGPRGALGVNFSTSGAGTGRIRLRVYKGGGIPSDSGWYNVTVNENVAPTVTMMQPTNSVTVQYPTIQFGWCDNLSLNASSRYVKVNGTDVTSSFDYTTATGPSGCTTTKASSTSNSVSLNLGGNSLEAHICDNAGNCATIFPSITRSDVTPPAITLLSPSTVFSQFGQMALQWCDNESLNSTVRWIKVNGVDQTATFNYVTGGSGCNVAASSTTSTVALNVGANSLQAYICDNWSNCTTQSFTITREVPAGVALVNHNRDNLDESLCLTVAAGSDAEVRCGDLLVYHQMPAFKTMNVSRALTLVYNSNTAEPRPRVAVQVTLGGGNQPQSVFAQLSLDNAVQASGTYASWSPGVSRQLALAFDGSNLSRGSGIYPFSLLVRLTYSGGAVHDTTLFDTLLVVNRETSDFGAGWYVSGVENVAPSQPGNAILWIGGDGSARMYDSVAAGRWLAPKGGFRDTIVRVSSNYERHGQHGIKVVFDGAGRHVQTVNRLSDTTSFNWVNGHLSSIVLPPQSATYQFWYSSSAGKLDSIYDPGGRGLRSTVSNGVLTQLVDPNFKTVSFGYDSAQRLISRTNRRLASTHFFYGHNFHITGFSVPLRSQTDTATTTFGPWDEMGLALGQAGGTLTPADPNSVRTLLDGPRDPADVKDTTAFYVNRFGAPTKIVNALGEQTLITRADTNFPALPTQQIAANGFVITARYDARGNIDTLRAVNPLGDNRDAITHYHWNQTWDFADSLISPMGVVTTMGYDPTNGNRQWQQVGPDAARRITFHYGNTFSLLSSSVLPLTPADSMAYDSQGNLARARTPKLFWTSHYRDAFGQDTLVVTPIDSADTSYGGAADTTLRLRQRAVYDRMGRDSVAETVAPYHSQVLRVSKWYDAEGNRDSLTTLSSPDAANVQSVTTSWRYDLSNRDTLAVAADGRMDTIVYDPAGNVVAQHTRRGHLLQMTYDALNRLSMRIVPSVTYHDTTAGIALRNGQPFPLRPNDGGTGYVIANLTDTLSYDALGGVKTANNGDVRITRLYYPNGALKSEEQQLRDATGTTFSHDYVVSYSYLLDGKKIQVKLPPQLVPAGAVDNITLNYSTVTGELSGVSDPVASYGFSFNSRGDLTSITYPGSYSQSWTYDADGSVRADTIFNNSSTSSGRLPTALGRASTFANDARGKIVQSQDATGYLQFTQSAYSFLGHLTSNYTRQYDQLQGFSGVYQYSTAEQQSYDALGNVSLGTSSDTTTAVSSGAKVWNWRQRTPQYQAHVGRLLFEVSGQAAKTYVYDRAGNLEYTMGDGIKAAPREDRFTYYGADAKVRAADYRFVQQGNAEPGGTPEKSVFEEYRYDAFGRRVWVRAYKTCTWLSQNTVEYLDCSTGTLRRTIWDGNQELIEIQVPGNQSDTPPTLEADDSLFHRPRTAGGLDPNPLFGRVLYTPGVSVDQPIAVTRYRYVDYKYPTNTYTDFAPASYMLFWTQRGQMGLALCAFGQITCQQNGVGMWFEYPLASFAYDRPRFFKLEFQGTLIFDKEDGTRTFYRRNRVYDPASGRFTQEDPIGLAGGFNLYGFAGADPVNFSDPFGLCPDCKKLDWPVYGTREAAARGAMTKIYKPSVAVDREYVGELQDIGLGLHAYTQGRQVGQAGGVFNSDLPGYEGYYHSHGADSHGRYDDDNFSGPDKRSADRRSVPAYLITPKGVMKRYDYDPNKKEQGAVTTIGTIP